MCVRLYLLLGKEECSPRGPCYPEEEDPHQGDIPSPQDSHAQPHPKIPQEKHPQEA